MSIWKYADKWGAPPEADAVTMGEGEYAADSLAAKIGPALGLQNLWFKYEGGESDRFLQGPVCGGGGDTLEA